MNWELKPNFFFIKQWKIELTHQRHHSVLAVTDSLNVLHHLSLTHLRKLTSVIQTEVKFSFFLAFAWLKCLPTFLSCPGRVSKSNGNPNGNVLGAAWCWRPVEDDHEWNNVLKSESDNAVVQLYAIRPMLRAGDENIFVLDDRRTQKQSCVLFVMLCHVLGVLCLWTVGMNWDFLFTVRGTSAIWWRNLFSEKRLSPRFSAFGQWATLTTASRITPRPGYPKCLDHLEKNTKIRTPFHY